MHFDADVCDLIQPQALEQLIGDLRLKGYSIQDQFFQSDLVDQLVNEIASMPVNQMKLAGVGRQQNYQQAQDARRDYICWLEETHSAGSHFLTAMSFLKQQLNRQLMLGLFDYEAHYARYQAGGYYEKHLDAFKGRSNRILSTVLYLNDDWQAQDGGEFVLFDDRQHEQELGRFLPLKGRLAVFLSEEFPHEVLSAKQQRHSIAGWFRQNNSLAGRIDPSR